MLSWKEIVEHYIARYSNQINQATKPLRDHFGLGYFTYHHIDPKGRYTVLVDRPDYAEYYVEEKIYLIDPYLRKPENYQTGICLFEQHGTEEYKSTVMKASTQLLDVDSSVMLIQKDEGGVEFFGFTGKKDKCAIEKLYLNDLKLLTSFGAHFKETLKPYLEKMKREANSLIELKGSDYLLDCKITTGVHSRGRQRFLADIGKNLEIELAAKLSKRERECLQWLLEDMTSKETAALLGLSKRTVESYFENIKNKLTCSSKAEIVQLAKRLNSLGLL